ncbi:discoidin domain-containing protein [Lutibacter aestuarii]|uniref:Discoidin domain-containing protein n=1 Tax=Lutibacter aestuarii TaxID=861111 RepID=A0ABW2Z3J3_9FLAO|nr:discoidin domain-containing protein [uncultured Lutibacter sp.]
MKIIYRSLQFIILTMLISIAFSCSKKENEIEEIIINPEPIEETFNYTSSEKYNLNIVYFIPSDIKNLPNSHKRLSEIFLHGQQFYKSNMNHYGFGNKTYNLLTDKEKNRVKIIYINGKYPTSNYPYEGGGAIIKEEVDAYFRTNPEENKSEHTIVVVPVKDQDNPDVPFYGWGKWCFALDYEHMDVNYFKDGTKKGADATKYIGGLLHELGHALNLPHNKQKVSESTLENKGTSLMGSGNYTYGNSPTFLTEASCAILNNNQIFGSSNIEYYTGASLQITSIKATYNNGSLNLNGTFQSDVDVNYVGYYNDPADDNADYDAVTWAAPISENNTFNIDMPLNELFKKDNTPYALRLRFCHINGEITTYSYAYKFVDNEPIIEFGDKEYLDRSNWEIESYSSQEDDALASYVLDNNPSTYWHSKWKQNAASYPHTLTIDMGENKLVNGFSFLQRDGMRKIKTIEILISTDATNWENKGTYELKNINTIHHINLTNESNFRFFKIIAKSAFDGDKFAAMAEIKCY